jgi:hypothetical protein
LYNIKLTRYTFFKVTDAAIEIMRRDNPNDSREGQLVFIERALNVGLLEIYGKHDGCYQDVLASSQGTTKGDTYLRHNLVTYKTTVKTFLCYSYYACRSN